MCQKGAVGTVLGHPYSTKQLVVNLNSCNTWDLEACARDKDKAPLKHTTACGQPALLQHLGTVGTGIRQFNFGTEEWIASSLTKDEADHAMMVAKHGQAKMQGLSHPY